MRTLLVSSISVLLFAACSEQSPAAYFDAQQADYCRASRECGTFRGTQKDCLDYYNDGETVIRAEGETCAMHLASYRGCWAEVKSDSCSASTPECSADLEAWLDCVE